MGIDLESEDSDSDAEIMDQGTVSDREQDDQGLPARDRGQRRCGHRNRAGAKGWEDSGSGEETTSHGTD